MKELQNKYVNIDQKDIDEVIKSMKGDDFSGKSEVVSRFEKKLTDYFSVTYAMACSNGTSAIHQALMALDVMPGDEVMLPPTAPVMTILPILAMAGVPVFVDTISDRCFGFSPQDFKNKITKKTKAIISVPMWGYPFDMSEIIEIARNNNISVIEDCSHSHGSQFQGKLLGTSGDINIFSTQERKLLCTGEGAFVLTNDVQLYTKMKELQMFGVFSQENLSLSEYTVSYGVKFGLNFKMNPMAAAMGCSQLDKLESKIRKRGENAKFLRDALSEIQWLEEIPVGDGDIPNYYAMVLRVSENSHGNAETISKDLSKKNIISDTYRYKYQPLYEMPLFNKYASSCPNAEVLISNIITLPTHEGLNSNDLEYIISAVSNSKG